MLLLQSLVIFFIIYELVAIAVYKSRGNDKKVKAYKKSIFWLIAILMVLLIVEFFALKAIPPQATDSKTPASTEVISEQPSRAELEASGCLTASEPGLEMDCYRTYVEMQERYE